MNGKQKIEAMWIIAVIAVLIGAAALDLMSVDNSSFSISQKLTNTSGIPENSTVIKVDGYQWAWEFTYTNANGTTVTQTDALNLTVGHTYTLVVTSIPGSHQFAVIHDLYIPQFDIQIYAVPGQNNTITFTPTKAGTFVMECVEYCGYDHYLMRGYVYVSD